MLAFPRPRILFSRCLGFEACRYDGSLIGDEFAGSLAAACEVETTCPECGIGLGVPRSPVRLVREGSLIILYQPASGRDCTAEMGSWCEGSLAGFMAPDGQSRLDGAFLKSRSPSCGPADVRLYAKREQAAASERTAGLFARAFSAAFPGLPVVDEGRARNFALREHFLISIYCRAAFREAREALSFAHLLDFHTRYKLLFMAYSPARTRVLGRILALHGKKTLSAIFAEYDADLGAVFAKPFRFASMINALQHAFGGLSAKLSGAERAFFLGLLEEYRDERIPLSAVLRVLKGLAIAQANGYLLGQRLLAPYPLELVEITDSGKGREG